MAICWGWRYFRFFAFISSSFFSFIYFSLAFAQCAIRFARRDISRDIKSAFKPPFSSLFLFARDRYFHARKRRYYYYYIFLSLPFSILLYYYEAILSAAAIRCRLFSPHIWYDTPPPPSMASAVTLSPRFSFFLRFEILPERYYTPFSWLYIERASFSPRFLYFRHAATIAKDIYIFSLLFFAFLPLSYAEIFTYEHKDVSFAFLQRWCDIFMI